MTDQRTEQTFPCPDETSPGGEDRSTALNQSLNRLPSARTLCWPLALSLLALGGIGWWTYEPGIFSHVISSLNPWILAAALGAVFARVLFGGLRLQHISHQHLSLGAAIRGQIAWDFASNITPSAIGGAPVTAYFISRDSEMEVGEATAVMLLAMVLDQLLLAATIPIVLIASLYISIFPEQLGWFGSGVLAGMMGIMLVWIGLVTYATLVRPGILGRLVDKLSGLPGLRHFQKFLQREMCMLKKRSGVLRSESVGFFARGFGLTAIAWISRFAVLVLVVMSVFPEVAKIELFSRTVAMTLSSLAFPTPGSVGGMEGLYALFIGPLIPLSIVAATLLAWRFLSYYLFLLAGIVLTGGHIRRALKKKQKSVTHRSASLHHASVEPNPLATEPLE